MSARTPSLVAALVAAAALALSGCGGGGTSTAAEATDTTTPSASPSFPAGSTMEAIAQAGSIKIGASPDQPGLSETDLSGEWQGFNIDLAEHLVAGLGLGADDIEWVNTTAANRIPFIQQGKIDLFATALAITPEREEAISIAGPWVQAEPRLIASKADAAAWPDVKSVPAGTKVCVLQGSQGQPRVSAELPQAEIVEFDVLTKCVSALRQGTVDAVDSTAPLLAGFVTEEPDAFAFVPGTYGTAEQWGLGVGKDRSDLCEYLNEQLQAAYSDGTVEELWADHMGDSGLEAPAAPGAMDHC